MTSEQIKALDQDYILPTYARFDLCLEQGSGCRATDPEGREYLDFTSGIGVNSLGFCDPAWVQAVAEQAGKLQHTSNLYYTQPAAQLAELLCARTGMAKAFFGNSGAEANEGAIKAARKYSHMKYGAGRHVIVTLENSFHGRTMATLSATGQDAFHQHFDPFLPGFQHIPANDIHALEQALDGSVCALMLEPIQGEGGIVPLDDAYLQAARELCTQRDVLLIIDEVQCGVGRTGKFLACQWAGVQPDVLTLAKGIGGGLPLGVLMLGAGCETALSKGDHATTYGGNPICCAGALAVMQRLDDAFLAEVAAKGGQLKRMLLDLPGVADVTGRGLMLGIGFVPGIEAAQVVQGAMARGMLCLTAKTRLRLLPPLVITEDEIMQGAEVLRAVLASV